MSKLQLLLIGLTKHHSEHISALKSNSNVQVVGVCNINAKSAQEICSEFNDIPYYLDYKDAIGKLKPEAILISVPHSEYLNVVEFALKKNIHIFKEKPFASNLEEANRIESLLGNSTSKIMIVSQRRFHKTYIRAKNLLKDLGEIKYVFGSYCFNKTTSGWRKNKKISGGGVIIDSGYHLIDLILYYFDLPDSVKCHITKLSADAECETEDFAEIELQYNDKVIQLILNRQSQSEGEEITIYGELGKLVVTKNEVIKIMFNTGSEDISREEQTGFEEAYKHQHESFFSSLFSTARIIPSLKEGILNTIVIDACYLSANNNSQSINTSDLFNLKGAIS